MWINVKDSFPEEGSLVIASSGKAWGFAIFEDGDFYFEDWVMGTPTGDIIEWMIPEPSNYQTKERNDYGKEPPTLDETLSFALNNTIRYGKIHSPATIKLVYNFIVGNKK